MSTQTSAPNPPSSSSKSKPFGPPRVGVGVFVIHPKTGKFVMGRRKGSHGDGDLSLPGGHLEHLESFKQCSVREIKEETGLTLIERDLELLGVTNSVFWDDNDAKSGKKVEGAGKGENGGTSGGSGGEKAILRAGSESVKHYVTIWMKGVVREEIEGEEIVPKLLEPEKCEGWTWISWLELIKLYEDENERRKLFLPMRDLIEWRGKEEVI